MKKITNLNQVSGGRWKCQICGKVKFSMFDMFYGHMLKVHSLKQAGQYTWVW